MQVPTPGQRASDQPEKTDPAIGVAVNITDVLLAYEAEQVAPQSIPVGVEVTTPVPDSALVTVSVGVVDLTPGGIGPPPPQPEIVRRRTAVTQVKKDAPWPEALLSGVPHPFILELFSILFDRVCVFISITPHSSVKSITKMTCAM
jgi:hypothetical protein